MVDIVWGQQANAAMPMVLVVPGKEGAAESAGIFDAAKVRWEFWPVLHGLELRLGKWVVIRDVRPRVCLVDAEVG